MSFSEIEARRVVARIDQKVLCQRAGVNPSTYSQIKKGHRGGYVTTLEKLKRALDALTEEQANG